MGKQIGIAQPSVGAHDHSIPAEGGQLNDVAFADGAINGSKITDASLEDEKVVNVPAGGKIIVLSAEDITAIELMVNPRIHIYDAGL